VRQPHGRRLAHLAARIVQRHDQGIHRLILFALRQPLHYGAAHLGILVTQARREQIMRTRVCGIQVSIAFRRTSGLLDSVEACSTKP